MDTWVRRATKEDCPRLLELIKELAAFEGLGLKVRIMEAPIGAAWALKMAYAGINKGITLLITAMVLGAARAGAADALHVSRPALSSLLNGKAGLSGEMALRIEKAFGVRMDTLMRMQSTYDIAQTRKREKEIRVRRVHRTADAHP